MDALFATDVKNSRSSAKKKRGRRRLGRTWMDSSVPKKATGTRNGQLRSKSFEAETQKSGIRFL